MIYEKFTEKVNGNLGNAPDLDSCFNSLTNGAINPSLEGKWMTSAWLWIRPRTIFGSVLNGKSHRQTRNYPAVSGFRIKAELVHARSYFYRMLQVGACCLRVNSLTIQISSHYVYILHSCVNWQNRRLFVFQ